MQIENLDDSELSIPTAAEIVTDVVEREIEKNETGFRNDLTDALGIPSFSTNQQILTQIKALIEVEDQYNTIRKKREKDAKDFQKQLEQFESQIEKHKAAIRAEEEIVNDEKTLRDKKIAALKKDAEEMLKNIGKFKIEAKEGKWYEKLFKKLIERNVV